MARSHELPRVGVAVLRRLGDRSVDELPRDVQHLLGRIREDLAVPSINLIFRVLCREPQLLGTFWDAASPLVRSPQFDAAVRRLRAVRLPRPPPSPPPISRDVRARLAAVVPRTQEVVPRLHLVMAGLVQSAVAGTTDDVSPTVGAVRSTMGPQAAAVRSPSDEAFLQRVTETYGHPMPASFLRQLASGPDPVLPVVWPWLQPWIGSRAYEAGRRDLVTAAVSEAAELGFGQLVLDPDRIGPVTLSVDELSAALEVFLVGYAPDVAMTASALSILTT